MEFHNKIDEIFIASHSIFFKKIKKVLANQDVRIRDFLSLGITVIKFHNLPEIFVTNSRFLVRNRKI